MSGNETFGNGVARQVFFATMHDECSCIELIGSIKRFA